MKAPHAIRHALAAALVATLTVVACASGPDSENPAVSCVKGTTQACLGTGRCEGVQTCLPDGSGYSGCECSTGGSGGIGGNGGRGGVSGAGGSSGGATGSGAGGTTPDGASGSVGTGGSGGFDAGADVAITEDPCLGETFLNCARDCTTGVRYECRWPGPPYCGVNFESISEIMPIGDHMPIRIEPYGCECLGSSPGKGRYVYGLSDWVGSIKVTVPDPWYVSVVEQDEIRRLFPYEVCEFAATLPRNSCVVATTDAVSPRLVFITTDREDAPARNIFVDRANLTCP